MKAVLKGAKKYSAPRLIHYGDLIAMTAAGSGSMQEVLADMGSVNRFP